MLHGLKSAPSCSDLDFFALQKRELELRGEFSLGDRDVIVYLPADPPSIQLDARAPVQDVKVRLDAERIRAAIEAELRRLGDPSDEPDEDGR